MKIGLALGSGASRGWSHIGVIKALKIAWNRTGHCLWHIHWCFSWRVICGGPSC